MIRLLYAIICINSFCASNIVRGCAITMLYPKERSVCFTGHRELLHSAAVIYRETHAITKRLVENGYCFFFVGGAKGFDSLAAQVVLEFQATHPQISLISILPFPGSKGEVFRANADPVLFTAEHYFHGVYFQRNRQLVDAASVCVAYLVKPTGGTAYTVGYAKKKQIPVVKLFDDPSFPGKN